MGRSPQQQVAGAGALVRLWRTIEGRTLGDLASGANVDRTLLSRIERGQRPLSLATAVRLLGALKSSDDETA